MREKVIMRPDRCKACRRCEVACIAAHHGFDMKEAMKRRSEFGPRVRVIKGENYKTTVRCDLCRDWRKANGKTMTACMEACPAQAIGILTTDGHTIFPEKNKPKPAAVKQVATKVDVDAAEITNR